MGRDLRAPSSKVVTALVGCARGFVAIMGRIAIVGGGVAGCYAAYRLASRSETSEGQDLVTLFEMSDRIGGRLLSRRPNTETLQAMEFGGMYIADAHKNLWGLLTRLGFSPAIVDYRGREHFLRGHFIEAGDYEIPRKIPFFVAGAEAGQHPLSLLVGAIVSVLPRLPELWPMNPTATPRSTAEYLRAHTYKNRPLYEWGFWNLLSDRVGHEAYEMMLAISPTASTFRNGNAYDTIWVILNELLQSQKLYRLTEGYQTLAERLAGDAAKAGVSVNTNAELERVERAGAGLALYFKGVSAAVEVDQLILAMPRRALERVVFGAGLITPEIERDLAAVIPIPACKLFLAFKNAWWIDYEVQCDTVKSENTLEISSTDLPMRQCFFFGAPKAGQPALVLAAFADDVASSYWKGLRPPDYQERLDSKLFERGGDVFAASPAMIDAALRQLQAMHPKAVIEAPVEAAYFDWSEDPYGAAWHGWKAYVRSWEVQKRMCRPNASAPIFICGEAYASLQGWVEGAINVTEVMLNEHFSMPKPDWIPAQYELEIEEEERHVGAV